MTESPNPYQRWCDLKARVEAMDPEERGWYDGLATGLLYAQAQGPSGDVPLKINFPERFDHVNDCWVKFDPQKFRDVIHYTDEGGIVACRMWVDPSDSWRGRPYGHIEITTSEGDKGIPEDWDERPSMTPEQINFWMQYTEVSLPT